MFCIVPLYYFRCDVCQKQQARFEGGQPAAAWRGASQRGWTMTDDHQHRCPQYSKAGAKNMVIASIGNERFSEGEQK